jgi:hypothetical protein
MTITTIIALAAVLVSVAALVYTWRQARQTRVRALSDTVRLGAAKMLTKLNRWQELATWFYFEINPTLVEAAEKLASGESRENVRDWTWKTLPKIRTDLLGRISDEDLETVSPELCAYDVGTLTYFLQLVATMRAVDQWTFEHFMNRSQDFIIQDVSSGVVYIGNRLRGLAELDRQRLAARLKKQVTEFSEYLVQLISSSDGAIMDRKVTLLTDKPNLQLSDL